jgi:uncharacterized membrane protein YdjX (TVP38/TMEM64 family)
MTMEPRQTPPEGLAPGTPSSLGIEETLFDEADIADAAAFEFEAAAPRNGMFATLGRIVRRKRFIFAAGIVVLAIVGFALKQAGYLAPEAVFRFLDAHPLLAPLAFLVLFVAMTLLLLPTLPLNLGAGFLWGPYWGGLYTVTGASIGAALAFLISRYLAAELVNRHFRHRTWVWLLEQVRQQNWKVVAFTRINPIFPTAPLNYFFGLTSIPFWSYLMATAVFIAPFAFLFAYLGDSVGGFLLRGDSYQFVQNILGASAAITALVALRLALKHLLKGSQPKS